MQQDFSKRIIIATRSDIGGWQSANTIAHISAYIGNKLSNAFATGETFISSEAATYPRNSQFPIIIKRAHNTEELRTLLEKVRRSGLMYHAFIREMLDHTDDEALQTAVGNKSDTEIELLGVGMFGPNDEVALLTKKFGLWK